MRQGLLELALLTDSLEHRVANNRRYLRNLQGVFAHDTSYLQRGSVLDLPVTESNLALSSGSSNALNALLDTWNTQDVAMQSPDFAGEQVSRVSFFPPLQGYISDSFESQKGHYGTDILAKKDAESFAVADGIVVISDWTTEGGYVLAIQHAQGFLSIYKHNAKLLKKVGDRVQAATPVTIVGNTGELTSGPHLHFELWYKGRPLNPENFIRFKNE